MEFESTIGDDVPVTVTCTMARAEPDVGIMSDWPEDLDILIDGKSIYEDLKDKVIDRIERECCEHYDTPLD